jgi:hypothetical protein
MEAAISLLEPILESSRQYGKTSLELVKLKSIDKSADILSLLVTRLLFLVIAFIFLITLTIAVALWLGDLLGRAYFGFLIVTAFYGIVGLVVYLKQSAIKAKANDAIITVLAN